MAVIMCGFKDSGQDIVPVLLEFTVFLSAWPHFVFVRKLKK
jgi:hypothetical protein